MIYITVRNYLVIISNCFFKQSSEKVRTLQFAILWWIAVFNKDVFIKKKLRGGHSSYIQEHLKGGKARMSKLLKTFEQIIEIT